MPNYWGVKLSCSKFACAAFQAASSILVTLEFCVMCGAEIEREKSGTLEPHVTRFFDGHGPRLVHLDCYNTMIAANATEPGGKTTLLQKGESNGGPPERHPGCVPDGYEETAGWLVAAASRTSIEHIQRRWKSQPGREGAVKEERSEVEDRP